MHIWHRDLHLFLYKMHISKLQTNANKAERHAFGQALSQPIKDHLGFLDFILFNAEIFHLSVYMNKHNAFLGSG